MIHTKQPPPPEKGAWPNTQHTR